LRVLVSSVATTGPRCLGGSICSDKSNIQAYRDRFAGWTARVGGSVEKTPPRVAQCRAEAELEEPQPM
jgi:hypothetical protein